MNAELISLIKWYIFDDGSIQNKLLNLQGEQLNKERLSFIFLDYLTKNNNLPDANVIEIYKNNWSLQYNSFYNLAKWYTNFAKTHNLSFCFIKGFSLSIKNYKDCLHRPFSDIDILIKVEDAEKFKKEMVSANFKLTEIKENSMTYEYYYDDIVVIFDVNFDKDDIFDKNRVELKAGMPVLSNEKHFLYLVLSLPNIKSSQDNIFNDMDVFPLYKAVDMLLLLKCSNLSIILEEGREYCCSEKIQYILSFFNKTFGTEYI